MSKEIVIDLTENMAQVGKNLPFKGEYELDSGLLPYPNATLTKVAVDFEVTFTNPDVEAKGTVTCFVKGLCDRCLEETSARIELPFCQTFYKDEAPDDGYAYSASLLDATKAVSDEIALSVPSLFLCNQDCKGLCPKCGTNLNKQTCSCDKVKENAFSILKNLKF